MRYKGDDHGKLSFLDFLNLTCIDQTERNYWLIKQHWTLHEADLKTDNFWVIRASLNGNTKVMGCLNGSKLLRCLEKKVIININCIDLLQKSSFVNC